MQSSDPEMRNVWALVAMTTTSTAQYRCITCIYLGRLPTVLIKTNEIARLRYYYIMLLVAITWKLDFFACK